MKSPIRLAILLLGGLAALAATRALEPGPSTTTGLLVAAGDARFCYEGRFDFSKPAGPVVIWEGSRIILDFESPRLALHFADATGQNFFNAEVDGVNTVVSVPAGGTQTIGLPVSAAPLRHHLVLFKRSEAAAGQARFTGAELAPGASAWAPPAPGYKLRMEFFGDSIMVGACNEDGATDQWENRRTHNNALSYTTLTAEAFSADYRCIAVSGLGVATGWVPMTAGEIWDRLYPTADSPRADLQAWQPDVALVNFGENDDSFPRAHGRPFPANYTAAYVKLVRAMRAAYPSTHFVLLRGGMYRGSQSAPLREAWTAAVTELESGDRAISHFVFTHWSANHPRVSDDRALANELIGWLRTQPFMRRFLGAKH